MAEKNYRFNNSYLKMVGDVAIENKRKILESMVTIKNSDITKNILKLSDKFKEARKYNK